MASGKIKCKFCDNYFVDVPGYVQHIDEKHHEMIPQDMVPYQYYYYLKTGKTHGSCVICKKDTSWNESTHKYNRFCSNPECKNKYKEIFNKRMIGKYGKVTLLNDPAQQKVMLSHRSISGEYVWRDYKHKSSYTGSYEKAFLEFLDLDLNFDPEDVMSPSPHTYYYEYEGKKHFYIPDFFIPSLSLEVEIKDGGKNPNTHPKIQAVDKVKEKLKDDIMLSNKATYSYIKITDKDHFKFLNFLEIEKEKFQKGDHSTTVLL